MSKVVSRCQFCNSEAVFESLWAEDMGKLARADEKFRDNHKTCHYAKRPESVIQKGRGCSTPNHTIKTPRKKSVLPRLWKWLRRLLREY